MKFFFKSLRSLKNKNFIFAQKHEFLGFLGQTIDFKELWNFFKF